LAIPLAAFGRLIRQIPFCGAKAGSNFQAALESAGVWAAVENHSV